MCVLCKLVCWTRLENDLSEIKTCRIRSELYAKTHVLILVHLLALSVKAHNISVMSILPFVRPPESARQIAVKFNTGTL